MCSDASAQRDKQRSQHVSCLAIAERCVGIVGEASWKEFNVAPLWIFMGSFAQAYEVAWETE